MRVIRALPSGIPSDDEESTASITGVVPRVITDEATARTATPYRLLCVAGADLGRSFRVATPTVTIGRGPVDIALQAKDVSRNHARLFRHGHGYSLEDLGSANGTYVNGTEVRSATSPLRPGDRIQIGGTILVFSHHDELEDRMHQLQRLEALASLAGGLAHDFNNALAVILSGLELFERRLPPGAELHDMVDEMKTAASSAALLARRLLRLGRTSEPIELEPLLLAPLVQRTVAMMRRQLPPYIAINVAVPAELALRGSQEELHQILINLMLNARDAMPRGGVLRISARGVSFDRGQAATRHLPAKGDYIELVFSDNGVGMDEATKARVFEPFFTTKPPGEGTGLGLAMIHGIVRRHGGAVVVESAPGAGSTFTMWLPTG